MDTIEQIMTRMSEILMEGRQLHAIGGDFAEAEELLAIEWKALFVQLKALTV